MRLRAGNFQWPGSVQRFGLYDERGRDVSWRRIETMGPYREVQSSMRAVRNRVQLHFWARLLLENMPSLLKSTCRMKSVEDLKSPEYDSNVPLSDSSGEQTR